MKYIAILIFIGLLIGQGSAAQEDSALDNSPNVPQQIIDERVMPFWNKITDVFSNFWDKKIQPAAQKVGEKVQSFFTDRIEKQKEMLHEELEKEATELKTDLTDQIKTGGVNAWGYLKNLMSDKEPAP